MEGELKVTHTHTHTSALTQSQSSGRRKRENSIAYAENVFYLHLTGAVQFLADSLVNWLLFCWFLARKKTHNNFGGNWFQFSDYSNIFFCIFLHISREKNSIFPYLKALSVSAYFWSWLFLGGIVESIFFVISAFGKNASFLTESNFPNWTLCKAHQPFDEMKLRTCGVNSKHSRHTINWTPRHYRIVYTLHQEHEQRTNEMKIMGSINERQNRTEK